MKLGLARKLAERRPEERTHAVCARRKRMTAFGDDSVTGGAALCDILRRGPPGSRRPLLRASPQSAPAGGPLETGRAPSSAPAALQIAALRQVFADGGLPAEVVVGQLLAARAVRLRVEDDGGHLVAHLPRRPGHLPAEKVLGAWT